MIEYFVIILAISLIVLVFMYRKYSKELSIEEAFKKEVGIEKTHTEKAGMYKFLFFAIAPIWFLTLLLALLVTYFLEHPIYLVFTVVFMAVYEFAMYTYSIKEASRRPRLGLLVLTASKERIPFRDLPFRIVESVNIRSFLKKVRPEASELVRGEE
jgi:hypothetical protein